MMRNWWQKLTRRPSLTSSRRSLGAAAHYSVGGNPDSIAAADLNGDGKLDLVTANASGNTVSALINKGSGTFQTAVSSPAGTGPLSVAAGDFDHNGKTDIAVVS